MRLTLQDIGRRSQFVDAPSINTPAAMLVRESGPHLYIGRTMSQSPNDQLVGLPATR
jgi:hypothetical protein